MSLRRRIGRNTAAKVLGEAAARGGGMAFYFLLARWLGPVSFGRYSFAYSYALLFAVIVDFGSNVILTREIARRPEDFAQWIARLNGLKLVQIAVFLAILAASLPFSLHARAQPGFMLAVGAIAAGTLALDTLNALFAGRERMDMEAVARGMQKVGLLAGAAIGYVATRSMAGTVGGMLGGMGLGLALTYLLLVRLGAPVAVRWDSGWNRSLLAQSLPLAVAWVFWNLYDNQDIVLLTFLGLPAATVGAFAGAMKLIDVMRGLPVLLAGAVFPLLAHAIADRAAFLDLAGLLLRGLLALAVPLAIGVAALAGDLVRWIYGPGFEPAAGVLRVAAFALIGICVNHGIIQVLVALDLQRRTIAGAAAAAATNLAALLVLTPRYGLAGAASALVAAEAAFLTINLVQLRGRAPGLARTVGDQALRCGVAGGAMAAVVLGTQGFWPRPLAAAVGALAYAFVLTALTDPRELRRLVAART